LEVYGIVPDLDQQIRSYKAVSGSSCPMNRRREIVLVKDYAVDKKIN